MGWFPFVEAARAYRPAYLRKDIVSSLTVALLDVPQGIAYAQIAGLHPVYGLYSSIVMAAVSALFNNSNHMICGPTNAISIVTASTMLSVAPELRANPAAVVGLLTLLVGLVQLAFGLLQVGNLSQFVSRSVLVGFTAGAGLLIALNQVGALLGLRLEASDSLVERLADTVRHAGETNWVSVALGVGTVAVILFGRRFAKRLPWPLLAIVAAAAAVWAFDLEAMGVKLVGEVPRSLPPFTPPAFDLGTLRDLADDALAIAILGCVESMSIAKSIAVSTGQRMNNNQDFVGMGLSHVAGAFFHCMPGCGSFTRSALNHQSGAATRFSGFLCACWVAVILLLFGPAARYIPASALAGMLVILGLSLLKWSHIKVALFATRSDATVLLVTFLCTLFLHLETAIYVGVMSSLVLFLRKASAPHLVEYDLEGDRMREIASGSERSNPAISIIHVEGELFFGAAGLFEDEVRRLARDPSVRVVILRMKNARHLDATAVMALDALNKFLKESGRLMLISGATADVMRVLRNSGLVARMGPDRVFEAEDNLTVATRKALLKAKEFLGRTETPEVRVFYDESRAAKKGTKGEG